MFRVRHAECTADRHGARRTRRPTMMTPRWLVVSTATADMLADNPGTWPLHCHVGDHMHAGMLATFTIQR